MTTTEEKVEYTTGGCLRFALALHLRTQWELYILERKDAEGGIHCFCHDSFGNCVDVEGVHSAVSFLNDWACDTPYSLKRYPVQYVELFDAYRIGDEFVVFRQEIRKTHSVVHRFLDALPWWADPITDHFVLDYLVSVFQ
jgi:hypothetical protein